MLFSRLSRYRCRLAQHAEAKIGNGARARARAMRNFSGSPVLRRADDGIFGATVILTFTAAGPGEHYR